MSTLNIAMQNTALAREECSSDIEQVLRSANTMADIQKKAEKVQALRREWIGSIKPITELLESRTERVSLKGILKIQCTYLQFQTKLLKLPDFRLYPTCLLQNQNLDCFKTWMHCTKLRPLFYVIKF